VHRGARQQGGYSWIHPDNAVLVENVVHAESYLGLRKLGLTFQCVIDEKVREIETGSPVAGSGDDE
jgi:hypothetical protein